jgi:hypothetical protein
MLAAMDQVAKAPWIAPATSLPALILAFGKASEVETAIGIAFLVHRTCRFGDRAGSKEEGRATPVHASIVSSANWILNRRMLEKSMGLKDNLWFDGRRAGKHATRR